MNRWSIVSLIGLLTLATAASAQAPPVVPPPAVPPMGVPPMALPPQPPPTVPGSPLTPPGYPKPLSSEILKELVPALIDALKDNDSDIRTNAAAALAGFGRSAIEPMLDLLKDKNEDKELRANIVQVLAQMGPGASETLPTLMKCLKDKSEDREVRRRAAFAIQRICKDMGSSTGIGPAGVFPGAPVPTFPGGPGSAPQESIIKPVDPGLLLPSRLKEK